MSHALRIWWIPTASSYTDRYLLQAIVFDADIDVIHQKIDSTVCTKRRDKGYIVASLLCTTAEPVQAFHG